MPKTMAVTHADLAPTRRSTDLGSKTGTLLIIFTILSGVLCFVLCLIAEATRSQATWERNGGKHECIYGGSGKTPLLCGAVAFVGLAVSMVVEHVYMLIAIAKSPPAALFPSENDVVFRGSGTVRALSLQAAFFFFSTWICFGVGEILLLIGLSVESGHLNKWDRPRPGCLAIKQGLFSAAGVFSLLTVSLGAGLYFTALRAQRLSRQMETVRNEVLEASVLYASPPTSPAIRIEAAPRENPILRDRELPPLIFSKETNTISMQ